jgi:serine/threonine protein kinase
LLIHGCMVVVDSAPQPGEVVAGKYILLERIGEGGMGLVFLAEQRSLARKVVVKLLQPALVACDALVRQFHTEAVAACRVQHPGSVAVIDCGQAAGDLPFLVMEYVPGRLLSALITDEEIDPVRALQLVRQLLRTLAAAHASGVVHGDIKSDNIIVEPTADGREAVTLIDFGLARIDGRQDHIHVGPGAPDSVSGTPEYMAPELVRGERPGPASDLYAVGVILYELLTRRSPFGGGSPDEVLMRQLEEHALPPSACRPDRALPALLDEIVLRALAKDPQARFADAGDFARALTAALREGAPRAEPPQLAHEIPIHRAA